MASAEKQYVDDADDALAIMLSELGGRFGMAFAAADEVPEHDGINQGSGDRIISFSLTPESDASKVFSATLRCSAVSGEVLGPTKCDWPQYLFRDRLLGPFRESLSATAAASGLAGWALTMTYARYDARAWAEDELEEYLGEGNSGDPTVSAILVLPVGADAASCARAIELSASPLYGLGRNLEILASREGVSPLSDPMYIADIRYEYASERNSRPSYEEIERHICGWEESGDAAAWDGTSNGGNPELGSHLPQVTWCPGYGPEA